MRSKSLVQKVSLILEAIRRIKPSSIFFCHYERIEIFISAIACGIMGITTFVMNDSKFDDYNRVLIREIGKSLFLMPYRGGLAAGRRSADYMRFLGISEKRIALGYDTVSVSRMRGQGGPVRVSPEFETLHFTIVARLLPKKNIALALRAFSDLDRIKHDRKLVICGSGPLERDLKDLCVELNIDRFVEFRGFVQTEEISNVLASSLLLILPSVEEQFGQVIAEAVALQVPVAVSENCGARDLLMRNFVNGFVFEPDNIAGLSEIMAMVSDDKELWLRLSEGCSQYQSSVDASAFAAGVRSLIN